MDMSIDAKRVCYGPFHLDLHCLHRFLVWFAELKGLRKPWQVAYRQPKMKTYQCGHQSLDGLFSACTNGLSINGPQDEDTNLLTLCAQRRFKSSCTSAQPDQNLRCPHLETFHSWLSKLRPVKILIKFRIARMHRLF